MKEKGNQTIPLSQMRYEYAKLPRNLSSLDRGLFSIHLENTRSQGCSRIGKRSPNLKKKKEEKFHRPTNCMNPSYIAWVMMLSVYLTLDQVINPHNPFYPTLAKAPL